MQSEGRSEKTKLLKAKGEFYKAVLTGESPREVFKAYEMLGAIPAADADLGYGDKLLPTTMSNELIIEPMTENPMRGLVRVSQIRGLASRSCFSISTARMMRLRTKKRPKKSK